MIDINAEDFIPMFAIGRATVGQVGYGFIGNAVVELFRPHVGRVCIYDKAKSGDRTLSLFPEGGDAHRVILQTSLDDVVTQSEVIFVAVPTPMKSSGECHTGIVEEVLQDIQNAAVKVGRDLDTFIVVIKSTVPPGFTRKMQKRFAIRIVFSPEFLTEKNAVKDFKTANRVLLGGDLEDCRVVYKYFEGVWPDRIHDRYVDHKDGPVMVIQCEPEVAEMVKLSTNVHLTARVMVSNELYLICQKMGVSYDDVKRLTQFDRRIGTSHMDVPGPDGHLGYGGHCFVKDTQSLGFISEQLGLVKPGHSSLFHALHGRNLDIREDRDWEAQKGRAVVDE